MRTAGRMQTGVVLGVCMILCLTMVGCGGSAPEPATEVTPTPEDPYGTVTALFHTAVIMAQFTPVPTSTPTPVPPTATPFPPGFTPTLSTPQITQTAFAGTLEALTHSDLTAPISITLPEGWVSNNFNLPLVWLDEVRTVPFTYYSGPLADGQATIAVLWGFDNITPVELPALAAPETIDMFDLWSDGVRLLVTGLLEPGCNPGLDVEREFTVGDRSAVGSYFAAIECPETPDISGWFAILEVDDLNFAFFVYFEPRDRLTGDILQQMQSIIDTVRFDLSQLPTKMPAPPPTLSIFLSPTPTP